MPMYISPSSSVLTSATTKIRTWQLLLLAHTLLLLPSQTVAHSVTFVNQCNETIYVGIVQNPGDKLINNGGLRLDEKQNDTVSLPFGWSGRFWGRTQCQEWGEMCETGRCGENWMNCLGEFPVSPVTFVDLRLDNEGSGVDFYSVSLLNGYNIPIQIAPVNGSFQKQSGIEDYCSWAGCQNDLNYICPVELQAFGTVGQLVGCRSACDVFQTDEYCCQGSYDTANTCTSYPFADTFKRSCQRAYSYAFDQDKSDFTCLGINYEPNKTLARRVSSGSKYQVTLCPGGEGTSLQWLPESKAVGLWVASVIGLSALTGLLMVFF